MPFGRRDQPCWLAETCAVFLLLLCSSVNTRPNGRVLILQAGKKRFLAEKYESVKPAWEVSHLVVFLFCPMQAPSATDIVTAELRLGVISTPPHCRKNNLELLHTIYSASAMMPPDV